MSDPGPATAVRIVVVEPARGAVRGTVEALGRLGGEARIEVCHGSSQAKAALAGRAVDLVVADRGLGAELAPLLEACGKGGAPLILVNPGSAEELALDGFRAGAADCVAANADYADVLPVVALEHIRRGRAQRERAEAEQLGRHVDDLRSYTENIIQNMNSALLVVDREGRISYANPTAERILDAEALRGRSVWDWFRSEAREATLVARTLREGTRFRGAETVLTRQDGSVTPVGISCAPLLDGAGAHVGAVAIFQDLTEIKQLQRQVLQTEKMASIGQLAAGVAHEINNPMGFIHANLCQMSEYLDDLGRVWEKVGALRKVLAGADATDAARGAAAELEAAIEEVDAEYLISDFGKAVRESLEGSERIRHIVQDLRAFSHQDTVERVEADLNKALDSTANIVWTMMKHSVDLKKRYQDLPLVHCFPMQLKQVFMNLLVNAYQAIEERGGDAAYRGEIRLRTVPQEGGVAISVSDNGTGIPAPAMDRIFDPFFTTKEVGVGTGLGLSTSFNLVQRHGGTIRVESELGVGTTFEVWLPLSGREEERAG